MKRVLRRTNLLIVALVVMLVACFTGATTMLVSAATEQEEPIVEKVELTSYTSVMNVDEEFEFAALATYDDGTTSTEVTWESSDIDVIDIDEAGLAYANAEGEAVITATAGDASASINVLVSDEAVLVEGVTVDPNELSLYVGDTAQLNALVLPEDATDKTVTWKSSNEAVATVDENGLVTAIGAGNANITVTTNDHMFTATCAVTVINEQ